MSEPHDPNETTDVPTIPVGSVDANATGGYTPQPDATAEAVRTGTYLPLSEHVEPATDQRSDAAIGTVIAGRYTLVKAIGQGGMGSVYLASQSNPVKRQVALKLIRTGMDSKTVLIRFEAERQALAMMDHPNIARIYDGGVTPAGRPFFVMELVHGVPITRYCDERHLDIRARLELFVAVCQAVQHAHQKGIIHRDLKPGNVLVAEVDGRPSPKVIDFGVAKATEIRLTDQSIVEIGAIVGTPTYMSPEQADPSTMDIDTRTDVYALGVILYELLVGSTPIDAKQFKRGAILEMLRMVREDDPPRPSTKLSTADALPNIAANRGIDPAKLAEFLRGELDWVVMKAIEKDRTRRYESANGFARDVQRYLADEVVEARPPSAGYRLRKFARRHRGQVLAASLIFLTVVAGFVGTTIGLLRADEQRRLAENRLDLLAKANALTETERIRAEQNFGTARSLILEMGEQFKQMMTGQKDEKVGDLAWKKALDKSRDQFDEFRRRQPDDATLMKQSALLHRMSANLSRTLNDYPGALNGYAAAIQISEDLTGRFPENREYRDELALTLSDRSTVERLTGKLKDAAATLDRAFKLAEGPQGTLRDSSYRRTLGMLLADQSTVAYMLGHFEDMDRFSVRSRELWDQLKTAPDDERRPYDPLFAAMAVHRRALARRELGRTAEAMTAHDDAVARMKVLAGPKATRDERYWDCEARRERARTAVAVPERRVAAVADLTEVIPLAEKLIEEFPHVVHFRAGLAETHLYRGELLLSLDQPEPATAELTKSLAVSRELLDRHGTLTKSMLIRGNTFLALGQARAAAGKPDEAAAHWKNAAKVFEIAMKIDPDNFHHRRGQAEAERALKPPAK